MASGENKLFIVSRKTTVNWVLSNPGRREIVSNKLFRTIRAARAYVKKMNGKDKRDFYKYYVEPATWGPDN